MKERKAKSNEIKAKSKEMTNIAGNAWRNKTASGKKCVNEKENKIREKKKENKASPTAYTLLYMGQTQAEKTCSRMK